MIIGLTGKNASGKGEAGHYLAQRGFIFYSLSDALRDELKKLKKPITRDNLTWLGNALRDSQGPSVLADKILQKIEDDRHFVIDSFRNPEEVKAFRRSKNFFLTAVVASPKTRFERMHKRNRENDARTYKQFLEIEKRELSNPDPTKQNLNACEKMADFVVKNDGSLASLHKTVGKIVTDLLMKASRPSWDDYFISIAKVVASRSNCMKRKVAALIVKDGRVISTGYNGSPRGTKNCNEGGCPRCNSFSPSGQNLSDCFCSHAEENAIVQSAYHGISIKNSVLYSTFSPCLICTKMIINSGIKEVVFNMAYPLGQDSLRLLKEAKIKVRKVSTHVGQV